MGGNNVCTEGLYRGDIKFPPEVDVTSKERSKKGPSAGRGVIHYLLSRRISFYDIAKKRSKNVAKIC